MLTFAPGSLRGMDMSAKTGCGVSRRGLLVGAGALVAAQPALAQDWLNKGLEILGTVTGQQGGSKSGLSTQEIVLGLKDALRVGSERTVTRVGRLDGYFLDKAIHIPLPGALQDVQGVLRPLGLSSLLDDLELRLNRAAETAAPKALGIFKGAISDMTVIDGLEILNGPNDAATQYFRGKTEPELKTEFSPIIKTELNDAGAFDTMGQLAERMSGLPIGSSVADRSRRDLASHGLGFALDGLFYYLGREEAAIRKDPLKRTTDILKKVFG